MVSIFPAVPLLREPESCAERPAYTKMEVPQLRYLPRHGYKRSCQHTARRITYPERSSITQKQLVGMDQPKLNACGHCVRRWLRVIVRLTAQKITPFTTIPIHPMATKQYSLF